MPRIPSALWIAALALPALAPPAFAQGKGAGKQTYEKTCALCHGPGLAGAPKFGDAGAWARRLRAGAASLYRSALQGTPNGMPAKGGNLSLSDAEVRSAVDFMVAAAGGMPKSARRASAPRPETPTPAVPKSAPPAVAAAPRSLPAETGGDPNAFNRLMAPPAARNLPPWQDGIHDPANAGTTALQPPLASFQSLPRSGAGNRVNWVEALHEKRIRPRWEATNPQAEATVMDLNIVREVKGSMPDVVYPHKQHTEWLDCSNCHPAIFVPQKGANQISMAAILLGQKCGVCHGKVAFPVAECRLCHSRKKDAARTAVSVPPTGADR
jgi:c(7)-type cytochrome triheme protein